MQVAADVAPRAVVAQSAARDGCTGACGCGARVAGDATARTSGADEAGAENAPAQLERIVEGATAYKEIAKTVMSEGR
jgi:hypothetical protein